MLAIGHNYTLRVIKRIEFGAVLNAENLGEVLLPNRYAPEDLTIDDEINVFLYLDSEARVVATTQTPGARVGEFAYLEAVANTDFGTFLDWGLAKDLLAPFGEQHRPMEVGSSYLVYVYLGQADGRITASSKIDKFIDDGLTDGDAAHGYLPKQAVKLIIASSTELGYKAIINHRHWGLLYKNEVFQRVSFGQSIDGYIKQVRPDGLIDVGIAAGRVTRDRNAQVILDYIESQGGFAEVHDKSDPALITRLFSMSKKAFKQSLSSLYKQRLIIIEKTGVRLADSTSLDD
ncbi:MAG: putative RNA-binding protein (virulence factor B family) [Candidatus Pseudothioglobus sp.]|jgi:predicted RNA-binding protein (virulence factor B family)